jgi:hypothetical protein
MHPQAGCGWIRIYTRCYDQGMPNQPATPNRAVRIDDETWAELGAAADAAGIDRSTVLRELARWWLRRPGAKLPSRPGDS